MWRTGPNGQARQLVSHVRREIVAQHGACRASLTQVLSPPPRTFQAMAASPSWWRELSAVSAVRVFALARLFAARCFPFADWDDMAPRTGGEDAQSDRKNEADTTASPACDSDSDGNSDAEEEEYDEDEWNPLGDYPLSSYDALAVGDTVFRKRKYVWGLQRAMACSAWTLTLRVHGQVGQARGRLRNWQGGCPVPMVHCR